MVENPESLPETPDEDAPPKPLDEDGSDDLLSREARERTKVEPPPDDSQPD